MRSFGFVYEQVKEWIEDYDFSYEEARDWINIGMGITDVEFCTWLRDVKRANAEWALNHGNAEQLRNEHQQHCSLIIQQVQAN